MKKLTELEMQKTSGGENGDSALVVAITVVVFWLLFAWVAWSESRKR